jgi:hypothetical protein
MTNLARKVGIYIVYRVLCSVYPFKRVLLRTSIKAFAREIFGQQTISVFILIFCEPLNALWAVQVTVRRIKW